MSRVWVEENRPLPRAEGREIGEVVNRVESDAEPTCLDHAVLFPRVSYVLDALKVFVGELSVVVSVYSRTLKTRHFHVCQCLHPMLSLVEAEPHLRVQQQSDVLGRDSDRGYVSHLVGSSVVSVLDQLLQDGIPLRIHLHHTPLSQPRSTSCTDRVDHTAIFATARQKALSGYRVHPDGVVLLT